MVFHGDLIGINLSNLQFRLHHPNSNSIYIFKSEGYLNRSFPGAKKGGMKGEVKRGEVVRECTGLEGEKRGEK